MFPRQLASGAAAPAVDVQSSIRPGRGWGERMKTTLVRDDRWRLIGEGRGGVGDIPVRTVLYGVIFGVVVVRARVLTDLDPAGVLRMRHDRTKNVLPSPGRRRRRR